MKNVLAKMKRPKPIIIEGAPQPAQPIRPLIIKNATHYINGYTIYDVEVGHYHNERKTEHWAIRNDYVQTWLNENRR